MTSFWMTVLSFINLALETCCADLLGNSWRIFLRERNKEIRRYQVALRFGLVSVHVPVGHLPRTFTSASWELDKQADEGDDTVGGRWHSLLRSSLSAVLSCAWVRFT